MTDWWDDLDGSDDLDRRKAERLARVLRRQPGDEAMHIGWCLDNLTLLEACADKDGALEGKARSGAIVSHCIRAYRVWWRSKGRELPQMEGKRENAVAFGTKEQKATVPPTLRGILGGKEE